MMLLARLKQLWNAILHMLRLCSPSVSQLPTIVVQENSSLGITDHVVTAAKQVGHIPEPVETIIQFADAYTQIHLARKVSAL
jgi:hypothetical protein